MSATCAAQGFISKRHPCHRGDRVYTLSQAAAAGWRVAMGRFVKRASDNDELPTNVAEKLHEVITAGTLEHELKLAIAYMKQLVANSPAML